MWVDIKGWENKYQVNEKGEVLNLKTNKLVSTNSKCQGYYVCSLYDYETKLSYPKRINRLVADAFIPNPLNKSDVHHIDGNKENNNIDNLEWLTPKEHGAKETPEQKRKKRETYLRNKELRERCPILSHCNDIK